PRLGGARAEPNLLLEETGHERAMLWMRHRTRYTKFALLTGISHRIEAPWGYEMSVQQNEQRMSAKYKLQLKGGETARLTKYISYHTTRDYAEEELVNRSSEVLRQASDSGFDLLAEE